MWSSITLMAGALFLGVPEASAAKEASLFQDWFDSAAGRGLKVPPSVVQKARSFRYVFVEGFRNERMPSYFAGNMAELHAIGILRDQVHVINPSSLRSSAANAEDIRARFLEIAGAGPERLVVIAHSRGACDALAFALEDPAFVRDHIQALFLIQGPFGGSGLADYASGTGVPMDRRMKLRHRIVANLIGKLARAVVKDEGLEAMEGMTPEASDAYWAKALHKEEETLADVGAKTFFIRSALPPSKQRFARRAMAWYLQTYYGPGDGVVALNDQSLSNFGTVLATLEAGHSDLTHKSFASLARRRYRRALSRSIVMWVGQERAESDPSSIKIRPSGPGGGRLDLREDTIPERQSSFEGRDRRKPRVPPADRVVAADR